MSRKHIRAVLFGPQGCGKGTQGELLAERFDIPLIGSGELFRAEIKEETNLGMLVKEYVDHGSLAPDELVNAVVASRLKKTDLSHGFILDGYPRNVEQAIHLDKLLKINLAINIRLTDREAIKRLEGRRQCKSCKAVFHVEHAPTPEVGICPICGGKLFRREDDYADAIVRRLAAYHFMTEPMAVYYRQKGVLLSVNGEQPIEPLFQELTKKITKLGFG